MESVQLSVWAEPWFVAGWFAGGVVSAALALRVSVKDAQGWREQRWAWAGALLFLSVVGLVSFACWMKKQRRDPASVRVKTHQLAIEWVASSHVGVVLALLGARQVQASPAQEWAMALAGSLIAAGLVLGSPYSSLRAQRANARARDWLLLTLLPATGCALELTWDVIAYPVVGAQPRWDTPAFWGFSVVFVAMLYAWSLPAVRLLRRGGFVTLSSSPHSARDVLSRRAGSKRLSLMGVVGLASVAVTLWLARRVDAHAEPRGDETALAIAVRGTKDEAPHRRLPPDSPEAPLSASLHVGLKGNLTQARHALLRERRRVTVLRVEAATRAAEVFAHLAPNSAFARVLEHLLEARRALHWADIPACRRHLKLASDELVRAPAAARHPQRAVELEAYHGAQVLNVRGEVVGRVVSSDTGLVELGLTEPQHQLLCPWSRDERRVVVHPRSLLLGPPRKLGVTNVIVPSMEPALASTR